MTFQQDVLVKKKNSFGAAPGFIEDMAAFPGKLHGISVICRKQVFFSTYMISEKNGFLNFETLKKNMKNSKGLPEILIWVTIF